MAAFILAHLSDAHLGAPPRMGRGEFNLKRGFGWINMQRRRHMHVAAAADLIVADLERMAPDHIVYSGDFANIGVGAEIDAGLAWIRRLGPPDRVSVVPGNHDTYSLKGTGPEWGMLPWRQYMTGDSTAGSGDGAAVPWRIGSAFPYVRRRGPIAIVGLNSSHPTPVFLAWGGLGAGQRDRLAAALDSLGAAAVSRVVVIHHPPLPDLTKRLRHLRDAPALADLLTRHGAELVIYGHNHRDQLTFHPGPTGAIPVVGVASASLAAPHGRQPPARYNLYCFHATASGLRIELVTRGLLDERGSVGEVARRWLSPDPTGARAHA